MEKGLNLTAAKLVDFEIIAKVQLDRFTSLIKFVGLVRHEYLSINKFTLITI
jgi:hypothetical protein